MCCVLCVYVYMPLYAQMEKQEGTKTECQREKWKRDNKCTIVAIITYNERLTVCVVYVCMYTYIRKKKERMVGWGGERNGRPTST